MIAFALKQFSTMIPESKKTTKYKRASDQTCFATVDERTNIRLPLRLYPDHEEFWRAPLRIRPHHPLHEQNHHSNWGSRGPLLDWGRPPNLPACPLIPRILDNALLSTKNPDQVLSLTQVYSVDFSPSRISEKKCVFNKRTTKVCTICC